jgi:hypothetical protein
MSRIADLEKATLVVLFERAAKLDIEVWDQHLERSPSFVLGYCQDVVIDAINKAYLLGMQDQRLSTGEREARAQEPDLSSIEPQDHCVCTETSAELHGDPDPYYGELDEVEEL